MACGGGTPSVQAPAKPSTEARAQVARFPWRGLMLDVARHYFPLETLKAVVDRMAFARLNTLHLHLSDDQGFRLALDKHPELTRIGAFRSENGHVYGGYYEKSDIRELIQYASQRNITIVPEIDLPGHTRAILASHPELSCTGVAQGVPSTFGIFDDVLCLGNEQSLALVSDIIDEVAGLFPASYIHIGGDEVPTHRWEGCPKCRARIAKERLSGISALQPWFTRVVSDMVRKHHKIPIAWDEVLVPEANLPKDMVVMAWRGTAEGASAAGAGLPVILAPNQFVYLNTRQRGQARRPGETGEELLPLEQVLTFDPAAVITDPSKLLGAEIALWTEYVRDLADIDAQLFPRMPAIAERFWSPPLSDSIAELRAQVPRWDEAHIAYYIEPPRGLFDRTSFLSATTVSLEVAPLYDGRVEVSLDGGTPFFYTAPFTLSKSTRVRAATVLRNGRRSASVEGVFTKESLRPASVTPASGTLYGATYSYFEGAFDAVPDVSKLAPKGGGQGAAFSVDVARRSQDYALSFRAALAAPTDGVYTFYVTSDDGSVLDVDGERIVDNDGRHAPREKRGQIALAKGAHGLALGFFQRGGGATLRVELEGPDLPRQELRAPLLLAP